jgi:hypothetical protein
MAKATPDAILDAMADAIKAAVTTEYVCSAEPANYAGIAAVALASVACATGDLTKADGDTNGRKVTVVQKSAVSISASGTATHVVLASGTTLLYVTTCTSQALTSGGTVTIPAWKIEVADPA